MPTSFYGEALARIHREGYEAHARALIPRLLSVLRGHGIRRGRIADLGCGAGVVAEALQRRRYDVWGVDLSPAMLRLARRRVPGATFIRGSLTEVALPTCHAAVAVGEVLNYLRCGADVLRTFGRVFGALRPGGIFVFDACLPVARWRTRVAVREGRAWTLVARIEEGRQRIERRIVWFRRAGDRWRYGSEAHVQRVYPATTLARWLRGAGFRTRVLGRDATHVLFLARR